MHKLKKFLRILKQKSLFVNFIHGYLNIFKVNLLSVVSDELFARINYRENTGKKLNLNNPTTFNEKLWWLKINYRTPLMTQCSDKIDVHNYLNKIGLSHLSNKIIATHGHAEEIDFDELKGKYFIKCNHVSGINAVFDSEKFFCKKTFIKKFNKALKSNYFYQSREWNYKNISPKILIEEFIESNETLFDYRFFCFDGKVKIIFVDVDTASSDGSHNPKAKRNIYDKNFDLQSFDVGREGFDPNLVKKPENLEFMISYAERIAAPFPFCRVDLYNIDDVIRFGEITFYPGGATQQFSCKEKDLEVASWITVV